MDPRIDLPPIQEPFTPSISYELPPLSNPEPYELAFPTEQRMWIRERDGGYSNMPLFDEHNNFIGFDKTPVKYLEVHHIQAESWYKRTFGRKLAERYMHNPLNAISLDLESHTRIHREWIHQYQEEYISMPEGYKRSASLTDYVGWQVDQGRPFWLTLYDKMFYAIAVIRTHDFAYTTGTFPFKDNFRVDMEYQYRLLTNTEPEFVKELYTFM